MIVLLNRTSMAADPHVQIRHRPGKIISEARKNAVEKDKQYIQDLKLDRLSNQKQILKLISEKQAIEQQAGAIEKKEYYRLDRFDHLISILYLSRLICLNQDDEQAIRDGILLNVKKQHIDLLLSKAKEQSGPFTFVDFLAGHSNVVFYELDEKPAATSDKDYENIRAWQTNQKISCIKAEFNHFRENFKKAVKDEIVIHDSLLDEIMQLQSILTDAPKWKAKQLIEELKKLKGLCGILFTEDATAMQQSFCRFLQGNNFRNRLSPRFLETQINDIEAGKASQSPVFGLSLFMYFRWLKHVSMFKKVAFHRTESSFDALFDNTFAEGQQKKDIWVASVKERIRERSFKGCHYERFILHGMEEQRGTFNQLAYPRYFTFLEQKEKLKNCFIEDCLKSFDIELVKEGLQKAIVLDEHIQFYSEELCLLKHNPLTPSAHQLSEVAVMTETLCHMAPGSELINLFLDTRELIKKQVYNDRIPLFFICENANGLFAGIFEKAVKNFKELVENLSLDDKGRFISELLREINYMEILNGIKCHKKNSYFKQFKHVLKNELKIVHELQSFRLPESNDNISKTETPDNKTFSFGYHPGPRELKPIMDALQLRINIFKDPSDVDFFIKAFTCEDLTKVRKTFKLGCQTNQFKSVMEYLEDYSTNFNPASIEKSGLFISKKGKSITANCINASNTDSMKSKHAIHNIFLGKH